MDPLLSNLSDDSFRQLVQEQRPEWAVPAREEVQAPAPRPSFARNALESVKQGVKGLNRGLTTDLLGAPVDLINMLLRAGDDTKLLPQRFSTDKPVGGSEWLYEKFKGLGLAPEDAPSPSGAAGRLLGGFINPAAPPALMAVMMGRKAAETAGGATLMKYLSGKMALERGEAPQAVWKKYGIAKTAEGDFMFESPIVQSEQEALDQFRRFYPKETVKVMLGKGEREGYFHRPSGEIYAQGAENVPMTDITSRRRVLEHELQHATDAAEGRTAGARTANLENPWDDPAYWQNAGEVRARNAEERLDPTLRHWNPEMTEEVSRLKQIIKQDPSLVAEAVKAKGGMWHPEAVERLGEPLYSNLSQFAGHPLAYREMVKMGEAGIQYKEGSQYTQAQAQALWSNRAIRNYLNKHAGTETDPLKDVEIPFGEGTKRWEEITDTALGSVSARTLRERAKLRQRGEVEIPQEVLKAPGSEQIWGLEGSRAQGPRGEYKPAETALTSYLSHVGDYLRQNVPADKLPQYDLVRAVKETAANDARGAKQMEKAQAESTKFLPVHKDYGDGYKWVEIRKPEKLTPEQMKQVTKRKLTEDMEVSGADPFDMPVELKKGTEVWTALGSDGKPVRNSYTGEIANGPTPEDAWLSGRLAEEGNQMGHCVGGYCEPVASGESKIYSLRDGKGKSHVTVEVAPDTNPHRDAEISPYSEAFKKAGISLDYTLGSRESGRYGRPNEYRLRKWGDHAEDAAVDPASLSPELQAIWQKLQEPRESILQIKGKQNRAPTSEYLPYVQDFVKSGKWGEVGDLQNSGLFRVDEGGVVHGRVGHSHMRKDLKPGYYTSKEVGLE